MIKTFKFHICDASYFKIVEECGIEVEQIKTILEETAA